MDEPDSDLMSQIEAFLRTGEGPPAAPEPGPAGPGAGAGAGAGATAGSGEPARKLAPLRHSNRDGAGGPTHRSSRRSRLLGHLRRAAPPGARPRRGGPGRWSRPAGPFSPPGSDREPPRWTPLRVGLVLALLLGLLAIPVVWSGHSNRVPSDGPDHASAAPAGPGYEFLAANRSGTPVRWNPCVPIRYQTDLAAAPAWAAADLQAAIARIGQATGLRFVDVGATSVFPADGPTLGADGQAGPVQIAWADAAQSAGLGAAGGSGDSAAFGRTEAVEAVDESTDHGVYVTGVMIVAASAAALSPGFGPGGLGQVLLHQLGRLVGLGSTSDRSEIMFPQMQPDRAATLGPGDLAGLQRLGAASGCLQVPASAAFVPAF